jgi:hypothetical protein
MTFEHVPPLAATGKRNVENPRLAGTRGALPERELDVRGKARLVKFVGKTAGFPGGLLL